ncbi:MAG: M48 family metalloprotease [Myxococcota bacterium]
MRRRRALAALAIACLARPPLAQAQNPFASDLTVEREKEMCAQIHEQIRQSAKLVTDPEILDYVDQIGESLVKVNEPQPYIFRFTVLEDPVLNAFTIGGGYVYITTGVLSQAGDVNELAGVLAHEIGHDMKRHVARQNEGQGLSTLLTLAGLAAAIASRQPAAMVAAQGINVSLQLKHSREFENEADLEGIGTMTRAGYDPDGMRRFFQRILAQEGTVTGVPAYLFTHPAVQERIADTKVEMERIGAPKNVKREDPRLAKIQARLARIMTPDPSGGSGLHARASFDASKTDPLMAQASEARVDGDDAHADALLAEAEKLEPSDPRVALERAQIATERGDLEAARQHLERALALDPSVPLVQYELGSLHARLGNKSRAAFYLEQAVSNFRPKTVARRRAEFELARLEFKVLEQSGLGTSEGPSAERSFKRGESVVWWGKVSHRFYPSNPEFQLRWIDPTGAAVFNERVRMSPIGGVSSTLLTGSAAAGKWRLEVRVEDSLVESYDFDIRAPA